MQAWTGDAAGVEASLAADRLPEASAEYRKWIRYLTATRRTKTGAPHQWGRCAAWRIVCSAYVAAGLLTIGHSDVWDRIDPTSGTVPGEGFGRGGAIGALYDFFQALPFWRMSPASAVRGDALASRSLAKSMWCTPHGGEFSVDPGSKPVNARWFNRVAGFRQHCYRRDYGTRWRRLGFVVNLT